MQNNILRDSNITKIFLIYTQPNGLKKKVNVKLRYMGDKECYFAGAVTPNFMKPKRKSPVEIFVYTTDGVYKATVKILDTNLNLNEIMYQVEIPKTWNFTQLRQGSRKNVVLPGSLKFNDGFEISFETFDLSVGGFSFLTEEKISSIHQRFSAIGTIEFPAELLINYPDRKLIAEVKFVRNKEDIEGEFGKTFFAMKFVQLTQDEQMILKNYLLSLE
ncbi:MAG: PilZ domain-containing protein [Candidatus Gastranaerophilales bacterium]|nr:PilZ domain-containing protein [Candidatus Gastranaerophilales bacterium]MCM1073825.1 PilZ domain-containing protein [Bacteroides sp.]